MRNIALVANVIEELERSGYVQSDRVMASGTLELLKQPIHAWQRLAQRRNGLSVSC